MSKKKDDKTLDFVSAESIAAYLNAAAENGDPDRVIGALSDVAHARGMNEIAKKMGVSREGLYKSLNGKTKPQFETIAKIFTALGLSMTIKPIKEKD